MDVRPKKPVVDAWAVGAWEQCGLPSSPEPEPDWEPIYLRLGNLPPGGKSFNHAKKYWEDGVAVFKGFRTPAGEYLVELQEQVLLAIMWLRCQDRPAYRVYGAPTPSERTAGLVV